MPAIVTRGLRKVYPMPAQRRVGSPRGPMPPGAPPMSPLAVPGARPTEIVALDGLDLEVGDGEFFGLLGPNGAGKTTTIGILTTRIRATGGDATVGGADVRRDEVAVRRRIGVVPQRPNPDRAIDALDNLLFHAAYHGVPRGEALARANDLLDRFGLGERAHAKVDELSGGQQQRLMIARALMHQPVVLFLDEPTVGLDPQARLALWDLLRELREQGRTIVLTTHYMEEADKLCDRIAIVDRGKLLALDTPSALKAKAPGGTLVELHLDGPAEPIVGSARAVEGVTRAEAAGTLLRAYGENGGEAIPALIRAAEQGGRTVVNINLARPSLETLFVSLTGRRLD